MSANERAANSMLRAQAMIDALTTTKVAAVAASAVAMTGSGLAVQQAVHHESQGSRTQLVSAVGDPHALSAAARRRAASAVQGDGAARRPRATSAVLPNAPRSRETPVADTVTKPRSTTSDTGAGQTAARADAATTSSADAAAQAEFGPE
jgi:hypothetical protein